MSPGSDPALLAHRGFAAEHAENTLPAFSAAAAVADGIECDARRCGSGEVVVCHDATVDRVTDGTGAVADHALADLRSLSVLDTDAGIPPLSAVYEAVPTDCTVHVELKETDVAGDVAAVAAAHDHETVVSSFRPAALAASREAAPALPRALVAGPYDDPPAEWLAPDADPVERALALDCVALHPHQDLALADDAALVVRAQDAGLAVNAWTVRDDATAADLRAAGVDGLIADLPV